MSWEEFKRRLSRSLRALVERAEREEIRRRNGPKRKKAPKKRAAPKRKKAAKKRAAPKRKQTPLGSIGGWGSIGRKRWARYVSDRKGSTVGKAIVEINDSTGLYDWDVWSEYAGLKAKGSEQKAKDAKARADTALRRYFKRYV